MTNGEDRHEARLVSAGDIELLVTMLLLLPFAWLLPSRWWSTFVRIFTEWRPGPLARRRKIEASRVPAALVELSGLSATDLANARMSIFYEELLQTLRLYRPGGWSPVIHVDGMEHMTEAVRDGRGVILWYSLAFRSLVLKKAFAGSLVQLARPSHPYSRTRFGLRFLNPVRRRVEDRLLRRRIVLRDEGTVEAMRRLVDCLRAGEIVSLSFDSEASQTIALPMLGRFLKVPTGPMNIARLTNAVLLPTFVVRLAADEYRIDIKPPIQLDGPTRDAQLEAGASVYGGLLETYVRRYPALWPEWPRVWRRN